MDLLSNDILTDLLDKALECPVCLEQLDTTARVLPCQHTFCRRCLLEIVLSRRELLCPECRVQCSVKVDDLPPNILLIRLLEGIKSNRKQTTDRNVSQSVNDLFSFGSQPSGPGVGTQSMAGVAINQLFGSQQIISQSTPTLQSNQSQTQSQQQSSIKQLVPTPNPPRAKALYNYDGKEPDGDLSFKKGDIIILRKRIDQNWFHGELNGKSGFLPASYVQVLVPPPSPVPPQCKALYDFRVTDVEEKDCLSFSKSDVLTVIRRVDENWAEGKLMDRIGIFPISFVEMNASARALMKLASINTNTPSRCAPPAPITASPEPTTSGTSLSGQTTPNTTALSDQLSTSQSPLTQSLTNSPQTVLSSLSHPNTSSSKVTNNTPAVMPVTVSGPVIQSSSPLTSNALPAVPVPTAAEQCSSSGSAVVAQRTADQNSNNNSINQKRHSLCSVSPPGMAPIYQRSQSQIESNKNPNPNQNPNQNQNPNPNQSQQSQQLRHSMEMLNNSIAADDEDDGNWSTEFARTAIIRKSLRDSSQSNGIDLQNNENNTSVPVFYVALYNYRPQKTDELELKKGELYSVSEKCHDGWYKGVSVRNGSTGVFPGNYVQLAKSSLPLAQYPCPVSAGTSQSRSNAKPLPLQQSTQLGKEPPIPKPKPIIQAKPSMTLTTTATLIDSLANPNSPLSTSAANDNAIVYARPRPSGQNFYDVSRNLSSLVPPPPPSQRPTRPLSSILVPNTKPNNEEPNSAQTQLAQALNQSLLISKPQSASQSSLNQSQWHQPKVAATRNTISMSANTSAAMHSTATAITPPPNVSVMTPTSHRPPTDRKDSKSKEKSNFIKRFTSSKPKRKHQINNNTNSHNNSCNTNNSLSCDNPSFVDTSPNGLVPIHIRSGSCPNESLTDFGAHKKQSSFDDSNTVIKNRMAKSLAKESSPQTAQPVAPPLVRERFRCVVPYPPNSEYELELQVGDVVYVHKKREDGWYKGTLQRTGKTGLFPGPFVESF